LQIREGNTVLGSVKVGADGKWSLELPAALAEGLHTLTTVTTDAAGNTSPVSNGWTVNVDTVAPNAPVISGAEDNVAGGIVGAIANGGLTNDNRPTFSGTAEANSVLQIREGNTVLGSVKVGADGKWSLELPAALADGVHTLTTVTTDAAGNTSPVSNGWAVNVDATAPNAPVISGAADNVAGGIVGAIANGGLTNDNRPTFSGTAEANSVLQ
ncbi:hypothetical protein GJV09_23225, partial [Enterobacteriaceae bacterium RIT702]|nr:hypothetical protein [Enterobacteriaceae bacterium RIT702]